MLDLEGGEAPHILGAGLEIVRQTNTKEVTAGTL